MKAKWLIALASVGLMLGLVGCEAMGNGVTPSPAPIITSAVSVASSPTPVSLATPTVVSWYSPVHWVAPTKIDIGNMYPGAEASTWVEDNTLDNGYQYKRGEPLCITIYNNAIVGVQYTIELDNGDYGQPEDYANWISVVVWNPIVPALSAMNIPVSIQIPKNVTVSIPHQWEFRLNVIASGQGSIQYAESIRFVITMK